MALFQRLKEIMFLKLPLVQQSMTMFTKANSFKLLMIFFYVSVFKQKPYNLISTKYTITRERLKLHWIHLQLKLLLSNLVHMES